MPDTSSVQTAVWVTALVAVMVLLLPWVDRVVCSRLRINTHGGLSANPDADHLLHIRRWLLRTGFFVYTVIFAYLVFFSRSAMSAYSVHVAPLEDLRDAFSTDHGFSDVFRRIFTEGFSSAFANVKLVRPEDLIQFYLNMMLFIPYGYLLPYVFPRFRIRVRLRPVLACFLISFVVENLQLMSRRGLYDLDDIISNTLGGFIGQQLYISVAYVVAHPGWRQELRKEREWKKFAKRETLYPFVKRVSAARTVIRGTDPDRVWDFYVQKLGFHPVSMKGDARTKGGTFLFQLGRSNIEIRCSGDPKPITDRQELFFSAQKLPSIRERLLKNGINTEPYDEDLLTGRRCIRFTGPDNVLITILEE